MLKIVCAAVMIAISLPAVSLAEGAKTVSARRTMVDEQIASRDVNDERVLEAMRKVPRHLFVPEPLRFAAHFDRPLPIGYQQTISQPFIVAYMTEKARVGPDDKVLEIGTGSGYQAAVLGELAREVYSIEIVEPLADRAKQTLSDLGYENIKVKWGDGYKGWPEYAPFDVILVTAAPPEVPQALLDQLKVGGRLIAPVGDFYQKLVRITRTKTDFKKESLLPVIFVPMVKGKEGESYGT